MIRKAEGIEPPVTDAPELATAANIYRIAWQRKSLVILGLVVCLVCGALYYAQKQPVYKSEASIHVIRKTPDLGTGVSLDLATYYMEDYLATHTLIIRSPLIVGMAVQNGELYALQTFKGNAEPYAVVNQIIENLTVVRNTREGTNRSSVLDLSFRGPVSEDCASILRHIIEAYRNYLADRYRETAKDVQNKLVEARTILEKDMQVKRENLKDHRRLNPMIDQRMDGRDPRKLMLAAIEDVLSKLVATQIAKETRIRKIEQAMNSDRWQGAQLLLSAELSHRWGGDQLRSSTSLALQEELSKLERERRVRLFQLGENHPDIRTLDQMIIDLRERIAVTSEEQGPGSNDPRAPKDSKGNSTGSVILTGLAAIKLELESINEEIATWETKKNLLAAELRRQQDQLLRDDELTDAIEGTKKLFDAICTQIAKFDTSKNMGGYAADLIMPPTQAVRVEPKALTVFTLATFFGLLSGLGFAYLADVTDKSFRSPDEIRRRLNLPVLGHIPPLLSEEEERAKVEGVAGGPDPILCTYYKPKSRKAEVFRGVRTALYFSTRGEGHKVIQITSPNMGDGKTTLSTNLAVSIAQSGKKAILIDADFRRPRIHKVLGVTNEVGFTSVLTGQCELHEAIQPTAVPGLSILACGPNPPNPAELLTSPRFKELVDELREQFDFVLLDTPPLLVVTDPCVVAPRVDGVLLCIRVARNGRPVAERAWEILTSLGANVLGVVVNGINLFSQGGYGYGYTYGYNYGQYDYANSYQYKYEYYDRYYSAHGEEYYSDKEGDAPEASTRRRSAERLEEETPSLTAPRQEGGGWFKGLFGKK